MWIIQKIQRWFQRFKSTKTKNQPLCRTTNTFEVSQPLTPHLQEKVFFLHTKMAVDKRYRFTLNFATWKAWNNLIQNQDPKALFLGPRKKEGDLWRMSYGPEDVFVVYKNGMVVTALEPNKNFYHLVEQALRRRCNSMRCHGAMLPLKQKSTTAKQAGRGQLQTRIPLKKITSLENHKVLSTSPLPRSLQKPKRQEDVLKRLRQEAIRRP